MRIRILHHQPESGFEIETSRGKFRIAALDLSPSNSAPGASLVSAIVAVGIATPGEPKPPRCWLSAELAKGEAPQAWRDGFEITDPKTLFGTDFTSIISALLQAKRAEIIPP